MSARESNLGYIRRTIKPALGSTQVRKVRGPLLDTLYARLMRCGNLACAGKPFTEHRNVPDLRPDRARRAAVPPHTVALHQQASPCATTPADPAGPSRRS